MDNVKKSDLSETKKARVLKLLDLGGARTALTALE
jgi:hypothetical protein